MISSGNVKNPVPPDGPQATKQVITVRKPGQTKYSIRNKIVCLNLNIHCYSYYQVQGAFTHLNQQKFKDLDEALLQVCAIKYYDDPLHLAIPYMFFMDLLPELLDGFVKSIISLALILFVYLHPIFMALIKFWTHHY